MCIYTYIHTYTHTYARTNNSYNVSLDTMCMKDPHTDGECACASHTQARFVYKHSTKDYLAEARIRSTRTEIPTIIYPIALR